METTANSRIYAGIASAALNALLLAALLNGLRSDFVLPEASPLVLIAFTATSAPPQNRSTPRPRPSKSHRGAAAPAAARAASAIIHAPRIVLSTPTTPAAPEPDSGAASNMGRAEAGSGSGAGGTGDGSGGGGDGDGGGSDVEWIGGRIGNGDYPRPAFDRGAQGTVRTEIGVAADGRATDCRVTRTSGDADLDATTCRLVLKRFRFRPATDAAGHPIADSVDYDQEWILDRARDGAGAN